jgi:PKD repeat protein
MVILPDCSAPGLLSTDFYGNPRVADPNATDAALARGTCHADRGPFERQDSLTMGSVQVTPASLKPTVGQVVTVGLSASSATSGWGEPVTYTADFGDGSAPATIPAGGTAQHAYTATGKHTITVTAADTGGTTAVATQQVTVYTAQAPTLTVQSSLSNVPLPDTAYFTVSAGSDAWEIASATMNFGDGTWVPLYPGSDSSLSPNGSSGHVYPKPGTYQATVTTTDDLGRVSTATTKVTVGDMFLPWHPSESGREP